MAGKNNIVKTTNDIELKDRLVAINRVTKVTKGGRAFTFSAIVVVGNDRLYRDWETDRKSTRLNSSHRSLSRMPSSA